MDSVAAPPPGFDEARNLRQQARAAGMDPDYWYAVEEVRRVKPGTVVEVVFWKRSIALFRGQDGSFHAVEDRCAHRQLKLSIGEVRDCRIVCAYHGWQYDGQGRRAGEAREHLGESCRNVSIRAYPVKIRYGLVWLFPGDPEKAEARQVPDIPELEGPDRWACVPLVYTWSAHHSMIIDNVNDFTHAHLHRRYRPFLGATLTRCETVGDDVHLSYETRVGRGRISGLFVDHKRLDTNHMDLCYQYPYQWSNTSGEIKHWLFVLPVDERTTRTFFLFYFKSLKIPMLPVRIPRFAMALVMNISGHTIIDTLLAQDKHALEAEQKGYEKHWDAPVIEFNPAVEAFQNVTARKWREHLARKTQNGGAYA